MPVPRHSLTIGTARCFWSKRRFQRLRFLGGGVWINHVAGLVLIGPHDDFVCGVFELIHRIVGDVLELSEDNARFGPLTVFAERDFADNGMD